MNRKKSIRANLWKHNLGFAQVYSILICHFDVSSMSLIELLWCTIFKQTFKSKVIVIVSGNHYEKLERRHWNKNSSFIYQQCKVLLQDLNLIKNYSHFFQRIFLTCLKVMVCQKRPPYVLLWKCEKIQRIMIDQELKYWLYALQIYICVKVLITMTYCKDCLDMGQPDMVTTKFYSDNSFF